MENSPLSLSLSLSLPCKQMKVNKLKRNEPLFTLCRTVGLRPSSLLAGGQVENEQQVLLGCLPQGLACSGPLTCQSLPFTEWG